MLLEINFTGEHIDAVWNEEELCVSLYERKKTSTLRSGWFFATNRSVSCETQRKQNCQCLFGQRESVPVSDLCNFFEFFLL